MLFLLHPAITTRPVLFAATLATGAAFAAATPLLETLGVAGSWGPIAGKFKPMTGGVLFQP